MQKPSGHPDPQGAPGSAWQTLGPEQRQVLRDALRAGQFDSLTFRAVTFRAVYPNANCLRFRDEDLPAFASSFVGMPFLRDHNKWEIDARGGTVRGSALALAVDGSGSPAPAFVQEVELTVPRDIEAFLNGQIDRFSIAWGWEGITCSVCGASWLGGDCPHWPGQRYKWQGEERLCELIFEKPRGREVSAVNVPAVEGTGVAEVLAQLCELKRGEVGPVEDESTTVGMGAQDAAPTVGAELLEAQRQAVLDARLLGSGLPAELHDMVRASLPAGWRPADLDQAMGLAQRAWAKLEEKRTVQNMAPRAGSISGMMDSQDQLTLALDGLLAGRRPERGVRPLSGIREFYVLMSGDYEMRGVFQPDNVGLANVTSSTMAGMVANALNKIVVNQFQAFPRWWEPIVTTEDFATLQQVRWITLGGIGALPTVAEGAGYTEMTWDDQTETASWVKKGGYLGLTLEAIDRDDTRRIQQAGPALARAAWLTLGKSVSAIFTSASGAGPTMADTGALFNSTAVTTAGGHANLGSTALSYTSFDATRILMRKVAELNSGERLGGLVVPKYLLVPPDLEATAVQIMASELVPAQTNFTENIYAAGNTHEARLAAARKQVIVVDFWTDEKDWAVVADPLLYPSIGLGFRFGREPEIFSVAAPNSGLMFSNDVLPVKVRYFFAVGPTDWRGMYKHNVA